MGSTRLRGKSLAPLAGRPALRHVIDRLSTVQELDGVVVATVDRDLEDPIRACAAEAGVSCYSGSEDDVLRRTLEAARSVGAATIVQVTGDCPLVEPRLVSAAIRTFDGADADYVSTVLRGETWPVGMDVEVFATDTLAEVDRLTDDPRDREHVSMYIYEHPERYRLLGLRASGHEHRPDLRLTLDTAEDLEVLGAVYDALWTPERPIALEEAIRWLDSHPDIAVLNRAVA
jgi:spore coat polysaccharide biosynthesis protein SpsF